MTPYVDLLQKVLTRELWVDDPTALERRHAGTDWPADAETMVGTSRLQNVIQLCEDVLNRKVVGDFMECGVWRGGCAIMMAAILKDMKRERTIWVADSFQGCPPPSPDKYPADAGDPHSNLKFLAIPREQVQKNFERYGLMGPNVKFLEGWFKDTLPGPVGKLSILRVDGDLYESTIQVLEALYQKITKTGYVIVDDYGAVKGCRQAVDDFRTKNKIVAPLTKIDWTGVYWQV
jgi:hypothetical protein